MRRGFTLLELMVTVTVIFVLVAILMPVIGIVRSAAESARCLSNVRQLAMGVHAYTDDMHGFLPPSGAGIGGNFYTWDRDFVAPYVRQDEVVMLSEGNERSRAIFRCPAARGLIAMSTWNFADYGLNGIICSQNDAGSWGDPWYNLRISQIPKPTEVYLIADTRYQLLGTKAKSFGPDELIRTWPWIADTKDFRHRGRIMMAFVDGRAASLAKADIAYGTYVTSPLPFKREYASPWGSR